MDPTSKQILIDRYKSRLDQYGVDDPKTIASGPRERHWMRFQSLIEIGDIQHSKILDLGCGTGDLVCFLEEMGIEVDYTGYDINPYLVEEARKRYPDRRFEVKDIQQEEFPQFDYVLGQAVFNYRLSGVDNFELVQDILKRCHVHAAKGVAFDFISTYADFHPDYAYPYSPEAVFSYAKTLTKRVTLRHDQPLFEFVIYLYPDFHGW